MISKIHKIMVQEIPKLYIKQRWFILMDNNNNKYKTYNHNNHNFNSHNSKNKI